LEDNPFAALESRRPGRKISDVESDARLSEASTAVERPAPFLSLAGKTIPEDSAIDAYSQATFHAEDLSKFADNLEQAAKALSRTRRNYIISRHLCF